MGGNNGKDRERSNEVSKLKMKETVQKSNTYIFNCFVKGFLAHLFF
jgi:hypothetical protein